MRAKIRYARPESMDGAGRERDRHSLRDRASSFQRRLWPARLPVMVPAVLIAFLLGALFVSYGSKFYEDWRQNRLLHQASALLHEGKFDEASHKAQELLAAHADSVPALYILAEAAEKQNLPEAVWRREQIARLLPKDADSQLNLASAALRFGKLDLAREALDRVAPNDRGSAAFHVVAGWLARAQGNLAGQEEEFAAAVKKEPSNDLYQFNLAALRIHSSDAGKNANARDTLQRLSKVAPYRTGALRALLNDAVARDDRPAADSFAQQLQMSPEVTFGDYLLCLNFYRKLDEKKFRLLLEKVKPFAARNSGDLASLMEWMNQNGSAGDVVKWIDKLATAGAFRGAPPPPRPGLPPLALPGGAAAVPQGASPPIAIAVADAYVAVKNWSRLKRWTRTGNWDDSEFLRLAYQAIATRQSRQNSSNAEFETTWRSAEQLANEQPEHELALARLASQWELEDQSEELWQRVARNPPARCRPLPRPDEGARPPSRGRRRSLRRAFGAGRRRPGERLPARREGLPAVRREVPRAAVRAADRAHRRRKPGRVQDPRRNHLEQLRHGLRHVAVAQAAHVCEVPRPRARLRLQAAAADRHAERVRLQLAEAFAGLRVLAPGEDPDPARCNRAAHRRNGGSDEARGGGRGRRRGAGARDDARAAEHARSRDHPRGRARRAGARGRGAVPDSPQSLERAVLLARALLGALFLQRLLRSFLRELLLLVGTLHAERSEERRVGKECRSRWS